MKKKEIKHQFDLWFGILSNPKSAEETIRVRDQLTGMLLLMKSLEVLSDDEYDFLMTSVMEVHR